MKKLLLLIFILISSPTFSNYSTPGTGKSWTFDSLVYYSNGNVVDSSGIYLVKDTIMISSPDTVRLLRNADIKLFYRVIVFVRGVLIINPPDSVKITSSDSSISRPYGLEFVSAGNSNLIRKVIYENCTHFYLDNSEFTIDSCVFRNIYSTDIYSGVGAIVLFRSSPVISNSVFYENGNSAIFCLSNGFSCPIIINNLIYANSIFHKSAYDQIHIDGTRADRTLIIKGNRIYGSYNGLIGSIHAGGIFIRTNTYTLRAIIENNIIKGNKYGIRFLISESNRVVLYNNIIDSNNVNKDSAGGYGSIGSAIQCYGFGYPDSIIASKNYMRGNSFGVIVMGSEVKLCLGDASNPDTLFNGNNKIYNNEYNGVTYNVINFGPDTIKAENNYWASDDSARILTYFYLPNGGSVDYIPFIKSTGIGNFQQAANRTFRLYDAYPNPFNPETSIGYDVSKRQHVRLVVYDALGREVLYPVNEIKEPGFHKLILNLNDYPGGIYFYRIITGDFIETKKLIFVK